MVRTFFLSTSTRPDKKYMIYDYNNPDKLIHFGASGYQSYPDHKNLLRKKAYILRHKARENWGKSGMETSGFWSFHLLWNKPTLSESITDTEKRFDIKIMS